MAEYYPSIKWVHMLCVAMSGSLFALRGGLHVAGVGFAHHAVLRYASYIIDSVLLTAALMLMSIIHQYPFVDGWLTAKIGLLALYVVLGTMALRRARSRCASAGYLVAAMLVFVSIAGIAIAHDARGWLVLLAGRA